MERLRVPLPQEQAPVRGGAISLFGDVVHSGGKKYRPALKRQAFQALVPLLFHLVDSCPAVVMASAPTRPPGPAPPILTLNL